MNFFNNLPDPIFINLEYVFFLLYRMIRGLLGFFANLFTGFRGGSSDRLRGFYEGRNSFSGSGSCNPFLDGSCVSSSGDGGFFSRIFGGLPSWDGVMVLGYGMRAFLFLLGLFLLFVLVYSILEWRKIQQASDKHIESLIPVSEKQTQTNQRWEEVLRLIESNNETDWRMAILEADAMLEDMTISMNLPGETLGERLKSVGPGDWLTLQQAWEAHKVRNHIAHQGSKYTLTHKKALETIKMFEEVFHEFKII